MDIQFCGAARNVTGSQHLLTINGKKLLLDCGLYQGKRKDTYTKNKNFLYNPAEIDAMVLSHAHIDHSGNIPNLVANGYDGPIYATSATVSLCQIMLRDSAHIQEKDIEYVNKRRARKNEPPVEPLYSMDDAEQAVQHFVGLQYDRSMQILPGVRLTFRDAGHILGSSCVLLEIEENGKTRRFGFSGDVGREEMPILRDPNKLRDLDVFIMESTYGNRVHPKMQDTEKKLTGIINETVDRGGKIIIPAFAVGRTQTLVYIMHKLFNTNRIPNLPIYVDSPLACNATDVFRMHPECFDRETYRLFLKNHDDPFGFGRLKYIRDVEDSKALNFQKEPHIIISASGMAEAGRILHHLKNNIGNPNNLILLVGYAAQHTLARKLIEKVNPVRIFGDEYEVKARIKSMDHFSGHADCNELIDYMEFMSPDRLKHLFLVHGEEKQSLPFMELLEKHGYGNASYPELGERVSI
ncbi:MAG: MBL fold metallo-hydrolase [candidate division KSB1 bacterium]|nr:MBL fold metallo-hydrolase [candidate division KSB1 bacterium]